MQRGSRLRAYRALLWLFPSDFREERGPELATLFRDMCAEWDEAGKTLGIRFWASLIWDTSIQAAGEWVSLFREAIGSALTQSSGEHMFALISDIRYAARQLLRQPTYSAMVVILMALGIAGNAAVFRVFNGLFLRPLPFENAEQLVDIDETAPKWDLEYLSIAYRDYVAWSENNNTFHSMMVFDNGGGNFVGDGGAQRVDYLAATHTVDEVLGLTPLLGRFFTAEEDHPDGPRVMMLSQAFWRQEYGSDPDVVGRTVSMDGRLVEIVGVLPAQFEIPIDGRVPRVWTPIDPATYGRSRSARALLAIARLGPGGTIESAREVLNVVTARVAAEHPDSMADRGATIASLHETLRGASRTPLTLLGGAALLFLLAACGNVAGLQLEQHEQRRRDLGVRLALGARSRDLVGQFLAEGVLLCLAGCLAALAIAGGALHWLPTVLELMGGRPPVLAMESAVPGLDRSTLASMAGIGILATAALALLPALALGRRDALGLLRSRDFAGGGRYRRGLVVAQVAISVVLLLGNGLLLRSFTNLAGEDPGFSVDAATRFGLGIPAARYPEETDQIELHRRIAARLERLPGVRDVGLIARLPLGNTPAFATGFELVADDAAAPPEPLRTRINVASAGFFRALEVPLLRGRLVDWNEGPNSSRALLVSDSFATAYLPEQPLGARLRVGFRSAINPAGTEWEVVGVVGDLRQAALGAAPEPTVYLPASQFPLDGGSYVLGGGSEGPGHAAAVREAVWEVDPGLQEVRVVTMRSRLRDSLSAPRTAVAFATTFGSLAILLTSLGIYGAIAVETARRRREIALRQALGARASQVFGLIVRRGLALSIAGTAIGLPSFWWAGDLLRSRLHGVAPSDPLTAVGVAALVALLTALACSAPAIRALRVAPMETIRES